MSTATLVGALRHRLTLKKSQLRFLKGSRWVLVELALDIELPETAIVVDHHNEMSSRPASILQVLALLGMDATRWQQLVAANDCGYIPAMLSMGATPEGGCRCAAG